MEAAPGLNEPRPLQAGHMLDDKYRIERLIAVGGMGAVYEGTHVKLRKRVAIKVLNRGLTSPAMIERFHREAITASQIGHEGIAQVTDLGTSATNEPFLVMELLEGESLAARLKSAGQLPVEMACELGCAILSPLAAAHAAGIVHRDLKPDNVFLVRQSRGELVKLLDFGISRASGLEQEFRLTTTGLVLGTPYYMSPEQARGETNVGPAADLYAFGVILYEMLIGTVPIKADNYNALIYRVMNGDYARPRTKRPELPQALEDIVMRAMALEPEERFASAAELEQHLLAFCRPTFRDHMIERISSSQVGFRSSSPLLPTPQGYSVATKSSGHDATVMAQTNVDKKPGGGKVWIALVAAALAAIGITVAVIMSTKSEPEKPAPQIANAPVAVVETPKQAVVEEPKPEDPKPANVEEPKAPAIERVTIRFDVEPANASIAIDGKPVTGTSFEVDKDDATHKLAITAKGHQPYEEDITFETQKLVIRLDKVGQKPTKRSIPPKKQNGKQQRIETTSPYGN